MRITRLSLSDFRNHRATIVPGDAAAIVLIGHNGAGKTNILEAASLLAPGRGLRGSSLPEMAARAGAGGFSLSADLHDGQAGAQPLRIGTGTSADHPARRRIRINGADQPATALSEWLSLLWLTPAMDRLFAESAGGRRRFLDRLTLALYSNHAHVAARYEAAMRARNRLLSGEAPADARWLAALEAQMAEHGALLDAQRHGTVAALMTQLAMAPIDGFPTPALAMIESDGTAAETPWSAESLLAALAQGRPRDSAAGRTLTGPHRQDLAVRHVESGGAAAHASTGEQKALLLSMILAHAMLVAGRRGAQPILLLDEVAAHLDPARRSILFARIAASGGQAWLTGTEARLFDGLDAAALRLTVSDGGVSGEAV